MIDYAFGSGHHATTFVSLTSRRSDQPTILEHRLTAYTHKGTPDITPGQHEAPPNKRGTGPSGRHYDIAGDPQVLRMPHDRHVEARAARS